MGRQGLQERKNQLCTYDAPTKNVTTGPCPEYVHVLFSGRERNGRRGRPSGGKRAQAQQVPQEAGEKAGGWAALFFLVSSLLHFRIPPPTPPRLFITDWLLKKETIASSLACEPCQ